MAKHLGADVWATPSAKHHDQLGELGADHLIDYRSERFEEGAADMDAVLDLVGDGDTAARSVVTLEPGGRLVSISLMLPAADVLDAAQITASFVLVDPGYAALERIAEMMASGALRVVIGEQRPVGEMAELHAIGQSGGRFGKLLAIVG